MRSINGTDRMCILPFKNHAGTWLTRTNDNNENMRRRKKNISIIGLIAVFYSKERTGSA